MAVLRVALSALAAACLLAAGPPPGARAAGVETGPMLGAVPPRSAHRPASAQGSGPLTYHGGSVLRTNRVYAIYWIPSGYTVSAGYRSLIDGYFGNVAAASGKQFNVYTSDTQYSDGSGPIAYSTTFGGSFLDTQTFPASGCTNTNPDTGSAFPVCLTNAQLASEISRIVTSRSWTRAGSIVFLFTPRNVGSCFSAGSSCFASSFCAYHSYSTDSGGTFAFANMPYAAYVSGCGKGWLNSPNHDDADATINVTSHEHNETITDPYFGGWWDAAGYENGDKCAWDFGTQLGGTSGARFNQKIGGGVYELQQEYSNRDSDCILRSAWPVPALTGFSPASGAVGATVTINGSGLGGATAVSIAGRSMSFAVLSDSSITATVPAGSAGGTISVTTPGGTATSASGFAVTGVSRAYSAAVLQDTPSLYWPLDESGGTLAYDVSAGARNGTYRAGSGCRSGTRPLPTFGAAGATADADTAVTLAGNDTNVSWDAGSSQALAFAGRAAFTLEAWVKPTGVEGTSRIVSDEGSSGTGYYLGLYQSGPTARGIVFARGGDVLTELAPWSLPSGTWLHLVATYDGTTMSLYVNGQLRKQLPSTASLTFAAGCAAGGTFTAGANGRPSSGTDRDSNSLVGSLDEVAVYPRALPGARVQAHHDLLYGGRSVAPTIVGGTPWIWSPSAAPLAGTTVCAVAAVANGSAPVVTTFQWQGSADDGATWTNVPGAGSRCYAIGAADELLRATETATNGAGSATATTSSLAVGYYATVLADAPAAYYRLAESGGSRLADSSANARSGSYAAGFTPVAPAGTAIGADGAASFDGASQYATVPHAAALDPAAFTVEAWVDPTDVSVPHGVVSSRSGPSNGYFLFANGAVPTCRLSNGSGNVDAAGGTLSTDTWTFLACTYDGSMVRLYVNGAELAATPLTGFVPNTTQDFRIGASGGPAPAAFFPGAVDDVAVYPAALDATRVAAHYAAR